MLRFLVKHCSIWMLGFGLLACSKPSDKSSDEAVDNSVFSELSRYETEQQAPQSSATQAKHFAQVTPGYRMTFPDDHQSHPDYAIEWWYLTANLVDEQNVSYAMQWTLFRFISTSDSTPWANDQQYMAHVGLRNGQQKWFEERFARGEVGNAGVTASPFSAFMDDWQWRAESENMFPSSVKFNINGQVQLALNLSASSPFVLHGALGFSQKLKNSAQASYYYSQPHIEVTGKITLPEGTSQVKGNAWFDHEWTSQYLDNQTQGWDWFSMHLNNGAKLMLFNMRHKQAENFWSGTLVTKGGSQRHLTAQDIRATITQHKTVNGRSLPLHWSFQLPEHGIDIQLKPLQVDQWNPGIFAYYEGGTAITGSHQGTGFIELTGY